MRQKQTKIICTLGENRCDPAFVQQLVESGMDVVRLNTAHLDIPAAEKIVAGIRAVSSRMAVLLDTKGPEVRTCNLMTPLHLKTGNRVDVGTTSVPINGFQVSYSGFADEVSVGSRILIDDGLIALAVEQKNGHSLICTALNDGEIKNKKGVNVPGVRLDLPALTEKDAEFIDWATRNEVDFIAHSFVRCREDVLAIQGILDLRRSPIKIIAKIENREGVSHLESILDVAYGIMVARGDLGIEIPAEEVPGVQKQMIQTCIRRIKPVITATQMLQSMIDNPRPTRAEVSDVANAIYDGTDAIMLSGETAYGKFPVEAVQMMAKIAHTVESKKDSLLAIGIRLADAVHTVSPSYAEEILRPSCPPQFFGGEGLEHSLQQAKNEGRLHGILNGCDYPANPPAKSNVKEILAHIQNELIRSASRTAALSFTNFTAFQTLKELQAARGCPGFIVTSISRVVDQKMLLLKAFGRDGVSGLEKILQRLGPKALYILVGIGDRETETFLAEVAATHRNFLFLNTYAHPVAEMLYASGDLFLMPSSFEPCGIGQMLALRGGQPCLVHRTGGLRDTVLHGINGFCFEGDTLRDQVDNLLARFKEALELRLAEPEKWQALRRAASASRFFWSDSAQQYITKLYRPSEG